MKKVLAAGLLLTFIMAGASATMAMAQDTMQMQQRDTTKAKKKHHKEWKHKEKKGMEKKGMEKTDTTSTGGGAQK